MRGSFKFGLLLLLIIGIGCWCIRSRENYGDERRRVFEELAAAGVPPRQAFSRSRRALAA